MAEELLNSGWSFKVANDPKHHPQVFDRPSTTVRKEWCRRPQEAHIADGTKYRRLSVQEIAAIQGFPFDWIDIDGITDNERIAVLGNAVPPPLSVVIAQILKENLTFECKSLLEICAGIGGLSYGFNYLKPIAKIELWDVAAKVLRTNKPWPASCVVEGLAQDYDYEAVKGKVGLLCGGPPCQPWSQAGHQKGADDPRDVMGFTPIAIAACEPEAFLFENVPGLFTANEHRAYVKDLLKRMGNPKEGLRYGVATTIVNTADFGIPQTRRRVLILGVKNKSNTFVNRILSVLQNSATHHDPSKPAVGKIPWITLRQAFKDIPCTEPWKKWNVTAETLARLNLNDDSEEDLSDNITDSQVNEILDLEIEENSNMSQAENSDQALDRTSNINHIELIWPGKNDNINFVGNSWRFSHKTDEIRRHSIIYTKTIGNSDRTAGYVVIGDYNNSLSALLPSFSSCIQTVYFDSPRLNVLANISSPGYSVSTWLSIVRESAINSYRLMNSHGFFILQCDEEMSHFGRQILDEVFGRSHHVTTFAWQKKYGPQNDTQKTTPTDIFDYIIVYSKSPLENIPKIGILQKPDDLIDDGDWRGCYTAGHKGAKSGNEATKFRVNAPPYRWTLLDSSLPKGKYWFDSITGVLWFENVEEAGSFWADVEVKDNNGDVEKKRISFSIREPESYNDHFQLPRRVWWLLKNDNDIINKGNISICTDEINEGVVGEEYCIVLKAKGGKPFTMKNDSPGTNRYWEFSLSTLIESIVTASASFGKNGTALPSRKTFYDRKSAIKRSSVSNWLPWYDFGKSEDASRHVKELFSKKITSGILNLTAKPQKLLSYLLELFTPNENDFVMVLGDLNAAMSSVALKMHRRFVHITGNSTQDLESWENTASQRLLATINGVDTENVEKDDPMPYEYTVEPVSIDILNVTRKELVLDKKTGAISITETIDESVSDFYAGLAGGYKKISDNVYLGTQGNYVVVVDGDDVLDNSLVSLLSSKYQGDKITIIAERTELDKTINLPVNVSVIHAPFDFIKEV